MRTPKLKVDSRTLIKINGAGEQINEMGDEVYGLTEEEIEIVENE